MSEIYGDSASISTTEYSLPNDSIILTPITTPNTVQLFLDLSNLQAGDEFELRIYEKVIGSASQVLIFPVVSLVSGMSSYVTPALCLEHGWDITLVKVAGSDRTIAWSIRTP